MPRRKDKESNRQQQGLQLRHIEPMTDSQEDCFQAWAEDLHMCLHGVAGTGKTFLAMYHALSAVFNREYQRVVVVRSVVPTRDMGFLPGNQKEKQRVYEQPYSAIATELFGRGDAYDILKSKNIIDFISTSFIRGVTLDNCVVVVDECQNMTFHELDSVITRMGDNCRVIFCGDYRQTDLLRESEKAGLKTFMDILEGMKHFDIIEFNEDDIVRSKLVKDYILTKLRHNIT